MWNAGELLLSPFFGIGIRMTIGDKMDFVT